MNNMLSLLDTLEQKRSLTVEEYAALIEGRTPEIAAVAAEKAVKTRRAVYGNTVFVRGLIEVSNICKNDCYYCGIRASNERCDRYRLTKEDILVCCAEGNALGFRTFVLQGGEDGWFTDERLCDIVRAIKERYPSCAVTLSMGERSYDSYRRLKEAGADRYLLRHETADATHYAALHPPVMSFERRMRCLSDLRALGFQTGCGFMVGSPFQTTAQLATDLKFIEEFQPDMCGIGPFIPHNDTPFAAFPAGSAELTCYLLSLVRMICPTVLLPSTTALGTVDDTGREKGILAGANVVMPNLSPLTVRKKYMLYNDKIATGDESAQSLQHLRARMETIGYTIVTDRGDVKKISDEEEN